MQNTNKSKRALRRKVLRTIGAGSAGVIVGGSVIPAVAIERDQHRKGVSLVSSNQPEPVEPSNIRDFDPYNPRQVIWLQNMYSKADKHQRKTIERKLVGEQKEALWDAYRPAFSKRLEGRAYGSPPKDMPIREMPTRASIDIESSSAEWGRKDIGEKWGWFDEL